MSQTSVVPTPPVQAQNQSAGPSTLPAPTFVGGLSSPSVTSGGGFNNQLTTTSTNPISGMYITGGGSGYVNVITTAYKKPRKPRTTKQKAFPLFTNGLETKLMRALGEDSTKIISMLSRKVNPPIIDRGVDYDTYEFGETLARSTALPIQAMATNALPASMPVIREEVTFYVKLHIAPDGTLLNFEFKMGGRKS